MNRKCSFTVMFLILVSFFACNAYELKSAEQSLDLSEVFSICPTYRLEKTCSIDDTFYHAPTFFYPEQEAWLQERETRVPWSGRTSCHVLHDVVGEANTAVRVQGKFVYNCDLQVPLDREWASIYVWGTGLSTWVHLGRVLTDEQGGVDIALPPLPRGRYIIKVVIVGDLSSANGYVSMLERGTQAVVFDIDELLVPLAPAFSAEPGTILQNNLTPNADSLVRHYMDRGFEILFFTRRPYWTATQTRGWLASLELPFQSLRFLSERETMPASENLLSTWLNEIQRKSGIVITRAYGSSLEDILAFERSGIAKTETYIFGEQAGMQNTVGIPNEDALAWHIDALEKRDAGVCATR